MTTTTFPGTDFRTRVQEARRQIREVGAAEARTLIAAGAIVLDVRDPQEYSRGHLPGSLQVSGSQLMEKAGELIGESESDVLVVCAGGNRSALAALDLQRLGYGRVVALAGGLAKWPEGLVR